MCVLGFKNILTLDIFGDGLRESLNAAGEVPGILLDVETQLFGAVHLGLHLLLKVWQEHTQTCTEKQHKPSAGIRLHNV